MPRVTKSEIRRVARRTVDALAENGYNCCLFGSAACSVWGMNHRTPKDIDVVVLTKDDPEYIKRCLVKTDKRFILVNPRDRRNTYKVLWFIICKWPRIKCKVDILVPSEEKLKIPYIPVRRIIYPNSYKIPTMPFFPLLILKLQGWRDHCDSEIGYMRAKIPQDVEDLGVLLDMLDDDDDHLELFRWLPASFIQRARRLVRMYVEAFPETASDWRYIGFNV
ncbi:hypothetical protein AX17_005138 [Amanita inopinata Kibby_2008]|nr:hypothetical protein AX17_005138 [Amanita inopinata Kibby_2008]